MDNYTIRAAIATDIPIIVTYLRAMLNDMAVIGSHTVTNDSDLWNHIKAIVKIDESDHRFWIAEIERPVGFIEARIVGLDSVFQPKRLVHIHAVYVEPEFRRQGIARMLMQAALEWGRENECVQAQLNTLVNNPARLLYEQLGFQAFEVKMLADL